MKRSIAVGIILLFIGTCIIPAIAQNSEKPHVVSRGTWLYVGGSGPGNYSKIQDAVDAASDGDTVFVYHDSSPYDEMIIIEKSITIQGEDKYTTIIDDGGFRISTDYVVIAGFTVRDSGTGVYIGGVMGTASHNTIESNLFLNVSMGVDIFYGDPYAPGFTDYGYNILCNNVIRYTKFCGIRIVEGRDNIIRGNDIAPVEGANISDHYGYGIGVTGAFNNISYNTVCKNERMGIYSGDSYNNIIYRNTIKDNEDVGLILSDASFDRVRQNNFINNGRDARIFNLIKWNVEAHRGHYVILPSFWDGNYWGKPRILPKVIGGLFGYNGILLSYMEAILFRGNGIFDLTYFLNYIRFDFHPATEPYDIPVVM